MAYAESTIGGTYGGSFRVWVNSIRTYDGSPAENYENWRCEGGVNRVSTSGGRIYNLYNNSTYTVQLGINGIAASGNWSYDSTGVGGVIAWGTGTTAAYRNSAGVGFGFTSRTDVNMQNSPYVTTGWVQSSDAVQTKYRHAAVTALSTDGGGVALTDEGPLWVEFSNPAGASVDAFLDVGPSYSRIFTSGSGISSRYNFTFPGTLTDQMQSATPNSNTNVLRIGIHDALGGDNWDYRDRGYIIKNDMGQANPIFSNFTFKDTNATTVGITGSDQVLIQGVSTLEVKISDANKAVTRKYANRGNYGFFIGGYASTATWPASGDVVKTVGTVSDITGSHNVSVVATDARGNNTTVTKSITVLPYAAPVFVPQLTVGYTNNYDTSGGLTVTASGTTIATISPMILAGTDKNSVNTTSGVKFDISKGNNTSYSGTWTNVATSRSSGSANITATLATIATNILSRMNTLTDDNTVEWFIKFRITDALNTVDQEIKIDIGRPIFRIGANGMLYHNEVAFFSTSTIASSPTPAPVGSASLNMLFITALAVGATFSAPSGTLSNGNRLLVRIKDTGTPKSLTWNSAYRGGDVPLPTTTIPTKTTYAGFVYNSTDSKWDCILAISGL